MASPLSERGIIIEQTEQSAKDITVGYEPNLSLYNLGEARLPQDSFWQDPHDTPADHLKKAKPPTGIDPYLDLVNELASLEAQTTHPATKQSEKPNVSTLKVPENDFKLGVPYRINSNNKWVPIGYVSKSLY